MTTGTPKTCGTCGDWQEKRDQCPDHGFCGHPSAPVTHIDDCTRLSWLLLPKATVCKLTR